MENKELTGQVLHIVSPERAINYKWEENADKLPSGLQIISIDDYNSLPDSIKRNRFGNVNLNDVLILEPYTKRYIAATQAEQESFNGKFDTLTKIARLLGATKVECKFESLEEKKRELNANGEISCRFVDVSVGYAEQHRKQYKSLYKKEKHYPGDYTLEGFKEAEKICKDTGLIYDPSFKDLLDQRNPNYPNPMKKETYHIELSREINDSFEIAFHLNILKGVFSLSAGMSESISSFKRLVIETNLEFA
jgi:hypothetical protein